MGRGVGGSGMERSGDISRRWNYQDLVTCLRWGFRKRKEGSFSSLLVWGVGSGGSVGDDEDGARS